jgi:hypothetical protein
MVFCSLSRHLIAHTCNDEVSSCDQPHSLSGIDGGGRNGIPEAFETHPILIATAVAREDFIGFNRRESFRSNHNIYIPAYSVSLCPRLFFMAPQIWRTDFFRCFSCSCVSVHICLFACLSVTFFAGMGPWPIVGPIIAQQWDPSFPLLEPIVAQRLDQGFALLSNNSPGLHSCKNDLRPTMASNHISARMTWDATITSDHINDVAWITPFECQCTLQNSPFKSFLIFLLSLEVNSGIKALNKDDQSSILPSQLIVRNLLHFVQQRLFTWYKFHK